MTEAPRIFLSDHALERWRERIGGELTLELLLGRPIRDHLPRWANRGPDGECIAFEAWVRDGEGFEFLTQIAIPLHRDRRAFVATTVLSRAGPLKRREKRSAARRGERRRDRGLGSQEALTAA